MRIGIDARLYGERGLGRYISQLLLHLESIDEVNQYVVVTRRFSPPARGGAGGGGSSIEYQPKDTTRFRVVTARSRWYSVAEQWEIPRIFSREQCDLVHFPHFNVPVLYRGKFMVTIHDFILYDFPTLRGSTRSALTFWAKYAVYRRIFRSTIERAQHIFVPSEYVRDRLFYHFPSIGEKKVTVTPEGQFTSPGDVGLHHPEMYKEPYILAVGSAYPHKNLEALINAFLGLKRDDTQLFIVGKKDYFMQRLEEQYISRRCMPTSPGDVEFLGEVSDEELAKLYAGARAVAVVSCEEGFGLPGVEAMQYGVPVIASDRSSLPEVYRDRAYYVNPYDVGGMRRVMEEVLKSDYRHRVFFRQHSVSLHGWQELAEATMAVYKSV